VALAGFSHADADGLRKIMSKKDKARKLGHYKERFITGARQRGVAHEQIRAVWDMMMSFSGYSFCKPHSASYARVSFQAAYLKTHYPAQFMAAVISNQGGFYSTFAYVSEARRLGVEILPPDVNKSDIRWKGRAGAMRVGWVSIKHLSTHTRTRIVSERKTTP
jgi:DNA polymerase-3 subunit alpha/error-prone DNA polymerase